jgi:MFS family permease
VGWSVTIIGTSFSTTYNEVLFWRIAMGLFCAFSTPTAYTLIAEKVPKDRLSLATSLYGTGVALGGALASLSILLDNQIGWSQTLFTIGLVGLVCAFLVAVVVPSDDSKSYDNSNGATIDVTSKPVIEDDSVNQSYSFIDGVSEALSTTRAKWIYGGSFLRFSSGLCIGVWSAPFFRATFPDNASEYAVAQALITAVAGSASGLAGGAAADYLSSALKTDKKDNDEENADEDLTGARLWIPVVGSLMAAPAWYLAIHSTDSFQIAMGWLTIEYLVAECWFGPTISTLLSTVPSKIGGTAQGLFTLTGAVANLSPTLLGYLYGEATSFGTTTDGVEMSSAELLPVLLTTGVCFGYVSSSFCFAMGARSAPPLATPKSKSN